VRSRERLRAFRLVGRGAALALDRLHVHADVRGALEEDGAVTVWLRGPLPPLLCRGVRVEELPAARANATATGRERDRAIRIADDLLVRPPWVRPPRRFSGIELVVPRGMAFGSGEHASTQAALRTLHATWRPAASFADVGTGSGILALYAQRRGCPRIEACDVDPGAVAAARALLPPAAVVRGGPERLPRRADVVAANMTAAELRAALPAILARWTGRGPLVLAGMRAREVAGVRRRVRCRVVHLERVGAFFAFAVSDPLPLQAAGRRRSARARRRP
jgi:ribosomal protein L11 methyltransferase